MYVCVCVFVDKSNPNKCMLCKVASSLLIEGLNRAYASRTGEGVYLKRFLMKSRFGVCWKKEGPSRGIGPIEMHSSEFMEK